MVRRSESRWASNSEPESPALADKVATIVGHKGAIDDHAYQDAW